MAYIQRWQGQWKYREFKFQYAVRIRRAGDGRQYYDHRYSQNSNIHQWPRAADRDAESGVVSRSGEDYSSNPRSDLTGSHVTSTKPVAVFAGQQRATVPVELADNLLSRDCLIERCHPSVPGENAFLTPIHLPAGAVKIGQDMYRILAAYDSTQVFIDGNFIGSYLNAGGVSGEF